MSIHYLIFALALFLTLRFLFRQLNSIPVSRGIHKLLLRIFPLVEFSIWLTFGFWIISRLYSDYAYYSIMVLLLGGVLAIIIGWYFLRDFISGIILKTEIPFEINQRIKTKYGEGILKKLGYRSIEIETENGVSLKIPYSQLASSSMHIHNTDNSLQSYEVLLQIDSNAPIQEIKDSITTSLFLLPWTAINKEPSIKVLPQDKDYNLFTVHFFSTSNRYAEYISQNLKNKFEKAKTADNF